MSETADVQMPQLSEPTVNTVGYATPEYLARLVFLSYRLSQGGIGAQTRLLLRIEEDFHPNIFNGDVNPEVMPLAIDMVGRYFLNSKTHPPSPYDWEGVADLRTETVVNEEVTGVFGSLKNKEYTSKFASKPADIAASVIIMDLDYLMREGGRADSSSHAAVNSSDYPRDPYDSHFVKYSLLGISTGSPEYDAIFAELSFGSTLSQLDDFTLNQLYDLIGIYRHRHPDALENGILANTQSFCVAIMSQRTK